MAFITIKTNTNEDSMTLQELIAPSDMESEFFCTHLVERVRWAVEDADVAAADPAHRDSRRLTRQR